MLQQFPVPRLKLFGRPLLVLPHKTVLLQCNQYQCLLILIALEEMITKAELVFLWDYNRASLRAACLNLRSFLQSCYLAPVMGLLEQFASALVYTLWSDLKAYEDAVNSGNIILAVTLLEPKPLFEGFDFNKPTIPANLGERFRYIQTVYYARTIHFLKEVKDSEILTPELRQKAYYLLYFFTQLLETE
jgi:hypothetical protein